MTGILVTPYITGEGKGMEVDEKKSHGEKEEGPKWKWKARMRK